MDATVCIQNKGTFLDRIAISMAAVCAVHCLITPFILVALPIISTTFWVHEHFHLWMLGFVIPTTGLAVYTGCRKHKDKWVGVFAATGLSLLVFAVSKERLAQFNNRDATHVALAGETPEDITPILEPATSTCCPLPHAAVNSSEVAFVVPSNKSAELKKATAETHNTAATEIHSGGCCPPPQVGDNGTGENFSAGFSSLSTHALLNVLGGLFLILGHTRNYLQCRKKSCCH